MNDSERDSGLMLAIDATGSQSALGRLIGKRQSVVSDWFLSGKPLPAEYVLKVEAATGVSRHELRPDLYPRDEPVPFGRTGGVGFASAPAASHGGSAPVSADDGNPPLDGHLSRNDRGASPHPVRRLVGDKAS